MTLALSILILLAAVLGAPVFVVISAFAMLGFFVADISQAAITIEIYDNFANNPLIYSIPLFTLSGFILAESNTSKRLIQLSRSVFGLLPGGLAMVSLFTCAFFTAFTGASGVTIVALGGLLFTALGKEMYPERFSLGLLTSSGSLGLLFAPSLPLIMYAVVSESSVFQVFVAGAVPGALLIALLCAYSIWVAKKSGVKRHAFDMARMKAALNEAKWELMIPFIVAGGLFGGIVTLGELATLIVTYVIIIEFFIYKDLPLRRLPGIMVDTSRLVGGMLIIMGAAYGLTNYMVDAEIPMIILETISTYIHSKLVFLIALNIFLLIVGCLLDIYSAIFVVVPLILPISQAYGIHPVHLGIIFLTNLEIGYSTPPVGMNLFIACLRFDRPVLSLYWATLPFIFILIIGLLLITYVPELSMWPVSAFGVP